ncbi:MAG: SDR family oxidoreductase, partial [Planctomycetota bacterium]
CDLADPKQQPALVARAFEKLDRIDAWIHLAGIDVLTGDAAKWDFETKLRKLFEIDVLAAIHVCRRVANVWRGKHQTPVPSITLVGWDQATRGMEGDAGQMFGPVKAAVTAFGLSLAQDVAPEVRVNVVSPGWIRTSWGESTDEYWDRRAREQALMGRWGTPEDVARAVAFAADPLNSFCTGQVIEVNGGFSRRFAGDAK